ncbi:MAG: mycothiol synthase [Acidobacteriota bacterium]|nr:mycothiol synthase [Acidobacteriota bacterium]
MGTWRMTQALSDAERLDVLDLMNRTESRLGREAIDEGRRRTVVHRRAGEHWLRYRGEMLTGYALLTEGDPPTLEMCGGGCDPELGEAVMALHGPIDWWTRGAEPAPGRPVMRRLLMLAVDLPVEVAPVPEGCVVRTFEPGRDDAAWLEQNNAAFANHPEQGAWRPGDLAMRLREPWFDPSGFLLLECDGHLAASCWTKVHELHPDRFGEIYVVSVEPRFQGRGLGRVMVTQGLDALRHKGVARGVLFVDDRNTGARALYDSLGFRLEREDRLVRLTP